MRQISQFILQHDADTITDPDWFANVLHPVLYSKMAPLIDGGTTQLYVGVVPFSPSYPNATNARGGEVAYGKVDNTAGRLGPNQRVMMKVERHDVPTGQRSGTGPLLFAGEASEQGRFMSPDKPCNFYPDYSKGEPSGVCVLPELLLEHPIRNEILGRCHLRSIDPDVSTDVVIDEPNTVQASPMYLQFSWLTMSTYMSLARPEQVRKGPRHAGQLGYIYLNMQGIELSKMFARQTLPANSLLYAVALNHWTGETGDLVALNKYHIVTHYEVQLFGQTREYARMIHVTNHTMDPNSTVLSPVGRHGRAVLWERDGGYEGAVARTLESFESWTDTANGTTTEYWFVTQKSTRGKLVWYVSLLVPRGTVMESIDLSMASIRTDSARAKADSTQQQQDVYIMIGCVMAGAVGGMLAISAVVARLVTGPIHKLQHDMHCVAQMNLDAVDADAAAASISEVAGMQESFMAMVRNLTEYRNYMPDSLLLNEDMASEEDAGTVCASEGKSRKNDSASAMSSRSSHDSTKLKDVALVMKRRQVTVVWFNIRGWHSMTKGLADAEVMRLNADVMSALLLPVRENGGIQDGFFGDHLAGAFNAFSTCAHHKTSAALAASHARDSIIRLDLKGNASLSSAVATGATRIGHLGCAGMKRVTILGHVMPFAAALERYNSCFCMQGLADAQVATANAREFDTKQRGFVKYRKLGDNPLPVFELFLRGTAVQNDEWMYEMEALEASNPHVHWNAVWNCVSASDWKGAAAALEGVAKDADGYAMLAAVVSAQEYTPHDLYTVDSSGPSGSLGAGV
eukprot:TRINITY_DN699_c1_g1_i18.p1 TRINITY_DN699_c1_g1~~TRINITY_DN699_c1_g1_i18.p1  ORF type:complete len:921 (+),score=231.87 TRINITY_DN699_c1_g1_i18:367-2763(+)